VEPHEVVTSIMGNLDIDDRPHRFILLY